MPANGPTALNDLVIRRIVDALKRGNTRINSCRLARVNPSTFGDWLHKGKAGHPDYIAFAIQIREAEAIAEDEVVEKIRTGQPGWQGLAWWLQRRNRARWGDIIPAIEKARIESRAANSQSLDDVPLADLEQAIQDAAELKRNANNAGKKEIG
jgi:hypothetical protein